MLESTTRHLEASTAEDVPPRSWGRITAAAETMAARLFPTGAIALRVISDAEIQALNRVYRLVDAPTDVLSFSVEGAGPSARPGAGGAQGRSPSNHYGDLALSWDSTQRQAAANGNCVEEEALALIAHGLLHLAGYDHDTEPAEARMHAATLELLRSVDVEVRTFGH